MKKSRFFPCHLLILAAILLGLTALPAQTQDSLPIQFRFELFTVQEPLGPAPLAVLWLEPEQGFYAYGHEPGATGQPTNLAVAVEPGSVTPEVLYPEGEEKKDSFDPSLTVKAYNGPTPLFIKLPGLMHGQDVRIQAELSLLLCSKESCWPVRETLFQTWEAIDLLSIPAAEEQEWWPLYEGSKAGEPQLESGPVAEAGEFQVEILDIEAGSAMELPELEPRYFSPELEVSGLGKAAILGFLAGLILNVMPCVLPVISLKLSALFAAAGVMDERRKKAMFREHNLLFALGILIYFVFLAVLLASAGMAWGDLFQSSWVILGLTITIFALALSLFGLYNLPIIDLKSGQGKQDSRYQPLFMGVLATLMATPCSGPLLGGVLGWALIQPPLVVAAVFICIGMGMASPYIVLAVWPQLIRYFPKPGPWNLHLERFVGFVLMATVVYFMSILPADKHVPTMVVLTATAFGAWMWGGWTNLSQSAATRWSIRLAALALIGFVSILAFQPGPSESHWQPLSQEEFLGDLGEKRLLVEFTADWCPNCKVLEKTTLTEENLNRWQSGYNLTFVRADLTRKNPFAEDLLAAVGSQSIPVVALFQDTADGSARPLVLRDLFSASQMDAALAEVFD